MIGNHPFIFLIEDRRPAFLAVGGACAEQRCGAGADGTRAEIAAVFVGVIVGIAICHQADHWSCRLPIYRALYDRKRRLPVAKKAANCRAGIR